jgi:DNA-directed RNA polymerase sigma subunit (sigma70/sigma32)/preprotein translocase subunit YajC
MTTEPFLYVGLDLVKSWREEQHPREQHGKFTSVKGGSRVVTSTGKTGVVQEAGATHHKIRFDDGKLGKVTKDNVLHEKDHAKVVAAQKKATAKAKRDKASATKAKATKTANRTNANGKTGAGKAIADPTAKKAGTGRLFTKKDLQEQKTAEPKSRVPKNERDVVIPKNKLKRDMEAPVMKRNTSHDEKSETKEVKHTIPQKNHKAASEENAKNEQNQALQKVVTEKGSGDQAVDHYIDSMWSSPAVQKILAKPANKRSAEDIRKVAGDITEKNVGMAYKIVGKMAESRGLHLAGKVSVIQRHQGAKRSAEGKAEARENPNVAQATGVYGDLSQAASSSMYETLHNILAGSQNPKQGTSIAAHVTQRIKQKLHRDIYDLMNEIPAPHEIRQAIGDMRKHETSLTQKLGRTPTHDELASHLEENSKHFQNAPIVQAPKWNDKTGAWENTNKRHTDPSEKLHALKNFHAQQKTTSTSTSTNDADGRETSLEDGLSEKHADSPEDAAVHKERQEELRGALPKAMREMGLTDDEIKVFATKYAQGSATGTKANLTSGEVAAALKERHGMDVTSGWVDNAHSRAIKKLAAAKEQKHPALDQLRMFKSLLGNAIMKALYEFDLVKSLSGWGIDHSVLEQTFVRSVYADSKDELLKSMAPYEYVGSYVVLDDGDVIANLTEFTLPGGNELYKSFNAMRSGLRKSMFPHKGGTNHAVNEKMKAYVKANAKKYKGMSDSQQSAAKSKGKGAASWSEQLLIDNPGSCWITWGGKRILVHGSTGEVMYDSANESHREDHNQGATEDKLEFHHEKEALDSHENQREKDVNDAWKKHISDKERNAGKGKNSFDYNSERDAFAKKNRGVSFDEKGDLQFERDTALGAHNEHIFDEGIGAFQGEMARLSEEWNGAGGHKERDRALNKHKALDFYSRLGDEDKAALDALGTDDEAKKKFIGEHHLKQEGVKEAMQAYHDAVRKGGNGEEEAAALGDLLKANHSNAVKNKTEYGKFLSAIAKYPPASGDNMDELSTNLGQREMSLAAIKHNQKLIPEGKYMIANPKTGKTMVIEIGGANTGGVGDKGKDGDGSYTSVIKEAFDPEGREHVDMGKDGYLSWGSLARALQFSGEEAKDLKTNLTQKANTDATKPFLKPIGDEEFNQHRAKTKAGLQDSMLHKDFQLVDQQRDKDGGIKSQTFAQKMPDGTTNHLTLDAKGMITDPLMKRLLNQREPITDAAGLNGLLKTAVGSRTWVTAHFGSDIHIGDALGHHVQIEYDGKGAPRVVGGKYDGYRYMDSKDLPKGTIDPTTGEPVKTLFKNGKLVDRRFSTQNDVAMKKGNDVMYPVGDGKFKKGRINNIEGDTFKITDGDGHVIGMFKKGELQAAKEKGRILANSGQAVVKTVNSSVHRMDTGEAFADEKPAAKELFTQALRKAKVNSAFDADGNISDNLELSDAMHRNLTKVLGKSKAGRAMMKKFNSTAQPTELEIHVPDSMREQLESEGVRVMANGTARISNAKFEHLRDKLGSLSMTHEARQHLNTHFRSKDREPKKMAELKKGYQAFEMDAKDPLTKHYQDQFKDTYVSQQWLKGDASKGDKVDSEGYKLGDDGKRMPGGLYSTQLEGLAHLRERGRAIAGHGMGTGKTILGVTAALHYKAEQLAKGETPKKTLIVAPKGIMSDWGKEIGSHTKSKGLFIGGGSSFKGSIEKDGKKHWGQKGNEQETADIRSFKKGSHAGQDHDFHIVSYDTFMTHRDHFASSGDYHNIVIDEVHAFKNKKGQRGSALAETTNKFKNVWALSGTPMENDAREAHALIDTVTGGQHELGNPKEFTEAYMQKDKNGKITGLRSAWAPNTSDHVKGTYSSPAEKLGDIMANTIQFRGGEDVQYNDGSKIHFPHLEGHTDGEGWAPKTDFMSNMVDRSRDHNTNNFYGTKHSITDFETNEKEVTNSKNGESYKVTTTTPKNESPALKQMYEKYKELEGRYLPESKRNELATAAATGIDQGKKGDGNYLTAMQKLGKFLNAPNSHRMFVGGGDALESEATDAQAAKGKKDGAAGLKPYDPKTGEGHYNVDKNGFKRYFESDGAGGYKKDSKGKPVELPPLHHDNPKAQYLHDRVHKYLDHLQKENKDRVKRGEVPMVPKMVVKSSYTTFGTDIVGNVLHDVRKSHPIFDDLKAQGMDTDKITHGEFTGAATDREATKSGFRGNKNDYAKNQGNLWATTVSPAGKEGVDFGNAHMMIHYDQDWNPQKMAQFTARVRRSDSAKTHKAMNRANSVRVESLHVPNTVEDFMFNAQDSKIKGVEQLTNSTRRAEENPKLGDTESRLGRSHRGFTSKQQPKKPKNASEGGKKPNTTVRKPSVGGGELRKPIASSADKAFKLVILL